MAPARFKRPISVISSPLRPLVIAAIVCTLTMALSRARRWMKSTSATWSMTGSVSGMTTIVVTPPAAAAWLAVFKVSRCSKPGSPVNTWASISPGASTWPLQSTTSTPSGALRRRCGPISAILPSRTTTPPGSSRFDEGSMTRALMKAVAAVCLAPSPVLLAAIVVALIAWAGSALGPRARPCAPQRPSPPDRG